MRNVIGSVMLAALMVGVAGCGGGANVTMPTASMTADKNFKPGEPPAPPKLPEPPGN